MRAHQSFRHEALLYRDTSEFLDAAIPFIQDGLSLQQPVMVATVETHMQAIRSALGDRAERVAFVDIAELGRNPARIIPGWQQFLQRHDGAPVRGIGEPIWADRRAVEIAECQLHEGLVNLVVPPDTPLWLMCPYDVSALSPAVVDEALHSHPVVMSGGRYTGSTSYSGAYLVQQLFTTALPEPSADAEVRPFDGSGLGDVGNRVLGAAFRAGVPADRAAQLAAAIREIAADVVAIGDPGVLRVWSTPDAVICEVRDDQLTVDATIGRFEATTSAGRKGLWRANQICDLIQVRSNSDGTAIRVHTWR